MAEQYDSIPIEESPAPAPQRRSRWVLVGAACALAGFVGVAAAVGLHSNAGSVSSFDAELEMAPRSTQVASKHYRLVVEKVAGSSDIVQIGQLELYDLDGNIIPFQASTNAPLCKKSQGVENLLDGNMDTKFCAKAVQVIVNLDVPQDKIVLGYRWASADDNQHRDPSTWKLGEYKEGSWETQSLIINYVHNRGTPLPRKTFTRDFSAKQETKESTYRFIVQANAGNTDITQLAQLEFKNEEGSSVPFTTEVADQAPCSPSQGAEKLVDGKSNTKFCTDTNAFSIILHTKGPAEVEMIRWMSANDHQERDPTTFKLVEYDVSPPQGSHHTILSKIDFIHKSGSPLGRETWTPWFLLNDEIEYPLPDN